MDFNERVIPGISSNYMLQEELSKYKFATKFIKKNMKVIDLGCGTGYGTAYLHKKGCEIIGIDINKEAVKFAAKKYGGYANFSRASVDKTGYKDKEFDFAVSFEVIEHLKNPKKFLKEVKRILKKNSYFVLSTPNTVIYSPGSKYHSIYHEKEFDYLELKKLLKSEFDKVSIFGQFPSKKAKKSWSDFLQSQDKRQNFVERDKFGIRKLLPKGLKEKVWRYVGILYGRETQEKLKASDFLIRPEKVESAIDFIAVCQN